MAPLRLVVVGTLASDPYAGMAWMHMQIAVGLMRLGHDVYYMEVTSAWPYDPVRAQRVGDSDYSLPYLERILSRFGLADRWAYRRSYSDGEWFGMPRAMAEDLLKNADVVINVSGGTLLRSKEALDIGNLLYLGTDPVYPEIKYAAGDPITRRRIDEHDVFVTYGENIGTEDCRVPPLPRQMARMRQPVLLDAWSVKRNCREEFTTVGNWKQTGNDIIFGGETYLWSKHHEILKFIDTPRLVFSPIEFATPMVNAEGTHPSVVEVIRAAGMTDDERGLLDAGGWKLTNSLSLSADPWVYRDYICSSRGEFTVARDLNVRLRSGWFSERSACYLAAGKPVITQDTGFGKIIPTGEGLFAFNSQSEIIAAFEAINGDYTRHSRAARAIAQEYFRAETVLAKLLQDIGL
jgi:hypothetical protein